MDTLFPVDTGRVRRTDPITSRDAARRSRPNLEAEILEVLARIGRGTDDQIAHELKHRLPASVKTARSRLLRDRKVCWTGDKAPSNAGSAMLIWKIR